MKYVLTRYVARCAKMFVSHACSSGTSDHLRPHLALSSGEPSLAKARKRSAILWWLAFACSHSLEAPTPAIACDGSAALDGIAPVWGRSGAGSLWLWAALREAGKGVFVSMSASPNETALSPESPRISSP